MNSCLNSYLNHSASPIPLDQFQLCLNSPLFAHPKKSPGKIYDLSLAFLLYLWYNEQRGLRILYSKFAIHAYSPPCFRDSGTTIYIGLHNLLYINCGFIRKSIIIQFCPCKTPPKYYIIVIADLPYTKSCDGFHRSVRTQLWDDSAGFTPLRVCRSYKLKKPCKSTAFTCTYNFTALREDFEIR